MFDFAFSELVVIMVVALIVIGPERLPKVARTAGHLLGRVQRYVSRIKADIANDMALEEMNQLGGTIRREISSIEKTAQDARTVVEQKMLLAHQGKLLEAAEEQAKPAVPPPPPTATGKPDEKS